MFFPEQNNGFKDNPNPPEIRFIRKHGRIIPIVGGHKKPTQGKVIEHRLVEMNEEVKSAEAGKRSATYVEELGKHVGFGTKSSFPKWYGQIGFKNKTDFTKALFSDKGKKSEALVGEAIYGLKDGYDSPHGHVPRNLKFRVATRQTFDNRNVVFRKVEGKVRPIRTSKPAAVPEYER